MTIHFQHETAWVPRWSFSDRLRRIRRELRMSQEEFALHIGANADQYKAWESGRTNPRDIVSTAKAIEATTLVPASWILGLDEPAEAGEADAGKKDFEVSRHSSADGAGNGDSFVFLRPAAGRSLV